MHIFDLKFEQLGGRNAKVAYGRVQSKRITVKRTINHAKPVTTISISAALMKQSGIKVGDRVLFGVAETDKGLVVKIWLDHINGYRLSPRNTALKNADCFGKHLDCHSKSAAFNAIPEGEYTGAKVGVNENEIFFMCVGGV